MLLANACRLPTSVACLVLLTLAACQTFDTSPPPADDRAAGALDIDRAHHRRILDFLNNVRRPQDLAALDPELISEDDARRLIEARDSAGPFGFRDIRQALALAALERATFDRIITLFGPAFVGRWDLLPYDIGILNGTAHASMLHTGWVLFFPRYDSTDTVLWNPSDEVNPIFEAPANAPTEFLFCSGHTFLSDGQLLTVGGGGNPISAAIEHAFRFDPVSRQWNPTAGDMVEKRWYPTAVPLGDGRVMVAAGLGPTNATKVEIYNPSTDTFSVATGPPGNPSGADREFPEGYPGLHLVPDEYGADVFFSRTGWGHGRDEPTSRASLFQFSGPNEGQWVDVVDNLNSPDRTEGMSVLIFEVGEAPRVIVVGGGDPSTSGRSNSETISFATDPPLWIRPPATLPDSRFNVNAVLLPDNTVLVVGGRDVNDSPALLWSPATDTWRNMAAVNFRRGYHSVALLLPSGKVATTGGDGAPAAERVTIEIFSPPYLFRGPRPVITSAASEVDYEDYFEIETQEADSIEKVVLVRADVGHSPHRRRPASRGTQFYQVRLPAEG